MPGGYALITKLRCARDCARDAPRAAWQVHAAHHGPAAWAVRTTGLAAARSGRRHHW